MYLSSRLVVVLCCLLISQVLGAPDLIIKNSCSFGLWAEARGRDNSLIPGESNPIKFVSANGGTVSYTVPNTGLPTTRFWVKYGCNSNGANCAIGDQIPNTNIYPNGGCPANGCTPPLDSLFEATWGCKLSSGCPAGSSSVTWFDTSQVDGFTLPYRVLITGNTQCDCTGSGCTNLQLIDGSRLNLANCPSNEDMSYFGQYPTYANQNLRYTVNGQVVACKSPCKHFTLPAIQSGRGVFEGSMPAVYYCCPTPNPSNCQPSQGCVTPEQCRAGPIEGTQYVNLVHAQTDNVYAYTYDDLVGLHTCPASGVQYTMEYCPPGSPAYPYTPGSSSGGATATGSSSSSSGSTGGCTTNTCGAGLSCCNTYNNGPACYSPSQYSCATNNLGQRVLCPAGYSACGDACYNPSQYNCVNGQLQPR